MKIHHLIWIQTGLGGNGGLGIRKKPTNISNICHSSYDVTSTLGVMGSVQDSGCPN